MRSSCGEGEEVDEISCLIIILLVVVGEKKRV